MKRWMLAFAGMLLVPVGYASADYIVIVANLGEQREIVNQPNGGQPGFSFPGGFGIGGMPGGAKGGGGGGSDRPGGGGAPGGFGIGGAPPGGGGLTPPPKQEDITFDPDAVPYYVTAVVEIKSLTATEMTLFSKAGQAIVIKHGWGQSYVQAYADIEKLHYRAQIIRRGDGSPAPPVSARYEEKHKETFGVGAKASTEAVIELARWALEHGLVTKAYDKFSEVMDELAGTTKDDKVVATYLEVKKNLGTPVKDVGPTVEQMRLQDKFKLKRLARPNDHYVVYHQSASDDSPELVARLDRLEQNFRSFYYWFALKGISLPMPTERQTAVITGGSKENDDFNGLHTMLTSSPVISDGFIARRENLSVFSARRLDDPYRVLDELAKPLWVTGMNRNEILKATPRGFPREKILSAQMMALLLKVMETDSERTGISHDATRQLVYGAGLLPRNVITPEWIQYGMGSFFETPLGSPWTSTGAPNMEHLPNFKDYLKLKRLEKTSSDTIRKVVTDAYFREYGKSKDPAMERKARAATWALTYFLMQTRPEGMLRYYKELSKQPRDVELDEDTLMGCFARAFDLVDSSNKNVDAKRLDLMGRQWYDHMNNTRLDFQEGIDGIREFIAKVTKDATDAPPPSGPGRGPGGPGRGGPGAPGGAPP
jgi:hypothetical protein